MQVNASRMKKSSCFHEVLHLYCYFLLLLPMMSNVHRLIGNIQNLYLSSFGVSFLAFNLGGKGHVSWPAPCVSPGLAPYMLDLVRSLYARSLIVISCFELS
jgi:hypothetical protein